jgi:hypothetical protein
MRKLLAHIANTWVLLFEIFQDLHSCTVEFTS